MAELKSLYGLLVAGVILTAIGVTLSVGVDVQETIRDDVRKVSEAINDSQTVASEGTTVARGYVIGLTSCANETTTWTIGVSCNISTPNSGTSPNLGVIRINTSTAADAPVVNFSYTYDLLEGGSAAAANGSVGIANLAKWQPTTGTVVAAGALITLLLGSLVAAVTQKKTSL